MTSRLHLAWERLSLYLPVLLMGLLALGTWWLVRNAPRPQQPAQERPVGHEPDYYMRDFAVKSFDATGRLQSEIRGTLARHYADNDTLEIDQARMRSVNEEGRVVTARANRALSNGDGSRFSSTAMPSLRARRLPPKAALQCRGWNSRGSSCMHG